VFCVHSFIFLLPPTTYSLTTSSTGQWSDPYTLESILVPVIFLSKSEEAKK